MGILQVRMSCNYWLDDGGTADNRQKTATLRRPTAVVFWILRHGLPGPARHRPYSIGWPMRLLMMLIVAAMIASVVGILGVQKCDSGGGSKSRTPPAVIQQPEPK